MVNRRYDVLFIDFYGTLVTGDRLAVERACECVVADLRLDLTPAQLAVAWGEAFFAAIEKCNHEHFKTLFELECDTLFDTVQPLAGTFDPTPYAGMLKAYWADPPVAPDAVEALRKMTLPVCVVSNADTEDILRAIERNKLSVDHVVTSEMARSYKPDRRIFETALQAMDVEPRRVLHAGDSLHSDVCGAHSLSMAACWVCYEDRILDLGTAHPDHKVCSLMELQDIL